MAFTSLFLGLDGVKTSIVGHLPKPMLHNGPAANLRAFRPAVRAASASSPSRVSYPCAISHQANKQAEKMDEEL